MKVSERRTCSAAPAVTANAACKLQRLLHAALRLRLVKPLYPSLLPTVRRKQAIAQITYCMNAMQRWTFAGALLLAIGASSVAAQLPATSTSTSGKAAVRCPRHADPHTASAAAWTLRTETLDMNKLNQLVARHFVLSTRCRTVDRALQSGRISGAPL